MSIQTFDSLEALVHAVDQTEINEWVFANLERVQSNPLNSTYYIIPEEELWELEDAGLTVTNHRDESIPASLPDHHVQSWLEVATVQDVIEVLRHSGSEPDIERIAQGLRYYHEYDAFME
ncbi:MULTISPECIES: DUF7716 domain-containing protein [Paenibacillus]|uniref:DUF7716 domain-containing protein n=1 Tax=Paenibacillus TaxID=44249 RepID=UPI000AC338EC|nr:hypothetical protein [Paenibacillus polymyxa]